MFIGRPLVENLYYRVDLIPFDKIAEFFTKNL